VKIGITVLVTGILFVVALALGAQNGELVSVDFLVAQSQLRLSWVMSGAFISGFALSTFSLAILYSRTKLQASRLRRRVQKQEQELAKLRSQLAGE
jgi:putative membrane protein